MNTGYMPVWYCVTLYYISMPYTMHVCTILLYVTLHYRVFTVLCCQYLTLVSTLGFATLQWNLTFSFGEIVKFGHFMNLTKFCEIL